MGSLLIVSTVVLLMTIGFAFLLTDGSRTEAQKKAEQEARMMSSPGAVLGEDHLELLPVVEPFVVAVQIEPPVPEMPLDEQVVNDVEEVVFLEADFMPLETVDPVVEEVLIQAVDVLPPDVELQPVAEPVREKGLAAVQLRLPLACEIRDPQLT